MRGDKVQLPVQSSALAASSDEELAFFSRNGKEEATAILIVRYLDVIGTIASRFAANGFEHDDFVQEGMIGFLNAVRSYREERGCRFNTYARVCVLNRLKSAVEFAQTGKYSLLSGAEELCKAEGKADTSVDPEMLVLGQETVEWFSREMGESLSVRERRIFLLYLEGYDPAQIAEYLTLSAKSVYNALGRVRKKLRAAFHSNQDG